MIDSEPKRASALDFCGSATGILSIIPDGVMDAGDRAHLLGLYSGFGDTPPGTGGLPRSGFICNMGRMMNRGSM